MWRPMVASMESYCKNLTIAIAQIYKISKIGKWICTQFSKNKTLGYIVGMFLPNTTKNVFKQW